MEDFVLDRVAAVLAATLTGEVVRAARRSCSDELLLDLPPATLGIYLQRGVPPYLYMLPTPPREKNLDDAFGQRIAAALVGKAVSVIEKPRGDRVLRFSFSNGAQLVLELIPITANVFLLDADARIVAARFADLVASRRHKERDFYEYPPSLSRLSWEEAAAAEFKFQSEQDLLEQVEGFGPVLAREVWSRCSGGSQPLGAALNNIRQDLRSSTRWYLYLRAGTDLDDLRTFNFHRDCLLVPLRLQSRPQEREKEFANFQEASSFLRPLAKNWKQFHAQRDQTLRELAQDQKKRLRLRENLKLQLQEAKRAETLMRYGELLKIESAAWKGRDLPEAIQAVDLFEPDQPVISIPLPRRESLRDNIDFYFRKAKRLEGARVALETKLERVEEEIGALDVRAERLNQARCLTDLPAAEKKPAKREVVQPKTRPFRRYTSSDGLAILVGKSNRENDQLTFREARSQDFWFHAADYPGSHVVVKLENRAELPPVTLREAAQLAAYFSKAKNLKKAAVHYTRKKNVLKMKKAAPGVVRLTGFKTIMVEPARKVGKD
jgi:predicted ribosome quality control (RQC) complex YloA/Tae2 family protein